MALTAKDVIEKAGREITVEKLVDRGSARVRIHAASVVPGSDDEAVWDSLIAETERQVRAEYGPLVEAVKNHVEHVNTTSNDTIEAIRRGGHLFEQLEAALAVLEGEKS